jgi:hypothetical protein
VRGLLLGTAVGIALGLLMGSGEAAMGSKTGMVISSSQLISLCNAAILVWYKYLIGGSLIGALSGFAVGAIGQYLRDHARSKPARMAIGGAIVFGLVAAVFARVYYDDAAWVRNELQDIPMWRSLAQFMAPAALLGGVAGAILGYTIGALNERRRRKPFGTR